MCTLRWCKHCTGLEVPANFRKFPFTALYGAVGDGVLCRPVTVGALFALTQGLYFLGLHILSFLFICTLRWCKHCTGLEVPASFHKIPLTELYGGVGVGVLCRPVTIGTLIAPTQGLYFWALHILSFFFMCTLRWCNHCTTLDAAAKLCKFPLIALYGAVGDGVLCRPVTVGALFALTQGLYFWAHHILSFLFMCTLRWYKRRSGRRCIMHTRHGPCAFCTNSRLIFLGSPHP